jgi:hypothetical protein
MILMLSILNNGFVSLRSAVNSLAALGLWFVRCAQTCGLFAALRLVVHSLRSAVCGLASMPFFDASPWQYESLLKSAKLTKTLVVPVGRW